jgi:hypothetical protein
MIYDKIWYDMIRYMILYCADINDLCLLSNPARKHFDQDYGVHVSYIQFLPLPSAPKLWTIVTC